MKTIERAVAAPTRPGPGLLRALERLRISPPGPLPIVVIIYYAAGAAELYRRA